MACDLLISMLVLCGAATRLSIYMPVLCCSSTCLSISMLILCSATTRLSVSMLVLRGAAFAASHAAGGCHRVNPFPIVNPFPMGGKRKAQAVTPRAVPAPPAPVPASNALLRMLGTVKCEPSTPQSSSASGRLQAALLCEDAQPLTQEPACNLVHTARPH